MAIALVLGLVSGSMVSLLTYRLPRDRPLLNWPRCTACGIRLTWREIIPVVGFVWQRGRCRYCGKRLPISSLAIELGTALAFLLAYLNYGLSGLFYLNAFFVFVLVIILVLDWRHHLIFSFVIYPAAAVTLILAAIMPGTSILSSLGGGLFGALLFLLIYWLASAIYGMKGLGFGDVLLAGLIGLMVGFPNVIAPLLVGSLLAGVASAVFLIARTKSPKEFIPFGAYLCFGTLLVLLLREPLWQALPLGLLVDVLDLGRLIVQKSLQHTLLR